jgi:hypothetical protein
MRTLIPFRISPPKISLKVKAKTQLVSEKCKLVLVKTRKTAGRKTLASQHASTHTHAGSAPAGKQVVVIIVHLLLENSGFISAGTGVYSKNYSHRKHGFYNLGP